MTDAVTKAYTGLDGTTTATSRTGGCRGEARKPRGGGPSSTGKGLVVNKAPTASRRQLSIARAA